MADLTQGIMNMQSRLNPDAFGAYKSGAEAYATPVKYGQELAKGQIELNQKAREQEIQNRLQKAIEESYDPAKGQPNYDKLAAIGHKYGITAQQMDYTIKHLKENWATLVEVVKNKRDIELYNKKGSADIQKATTGKTGWSNTSRKEPTITPEVQTSTTKGVAVPTTEKAQQLPSNEPLTASQMALTGASNDNINEANGIISGLNAAVESGSNPTGAPIPTRPQITSPAMDAHGNVVGTVGDSWNKKPIVAPITSNGTDASNPMDLGSTKLTVKTETTQEPHTLYGVANAIEAEQFPTPGATKITPYTEDSVKAMSGEWKAEIVRGLRNSGVQLPEDAQVTDKMISDGINTITSNAVSSLYKGYNPYDPQKAIGSLYEAEALAPETAQKAFQDLLAKGREVKTTRLGQASTEQSTKQAKTSFEQIQKEIADAKSRGYTKVNTGNISEFRDADAKYTQLGNARQEIADIRAESSKLSNDAFNSKVEAMLVGPKASEGITTKEGTATFMESIRKDPSLGAIFKDAKDLKELVMALITKKLSSQDRNTLLDIIDGTIESQMKTGVAKSKLDTFKSWSKRSTAEKPDKTKSDGYILVNSPAEAKKLAPGTKFKTPDGRKFTR